MLLPDYRLQTALFAFSLGTRSGVSIVHMDSVALGELVPCSDLLFLANILILVRQKE